MSFREKQDGIYGVDEIAMGESGVAGAALCSAVDQGRGFASLESSVLYVGRGGCRGGLHCERRVRADPRRDDVSHHRTMKQR